jgi:hypothetical protein
MGLDLIVQFSLGTIRVARVIGPEWISALGSVAGVIIAGVGLVFIWRQVRLGTVALQEQAEAATQRAKSERLLAKARLLDMSAPINRLIFEHPELYDLSYLGEEAHVPPEHSDAWKRAMILCEMQANYLEFVTQAIASFTEDERSAWKNFARETFNRPIFKVFWASRAHWYDPAIEAFANGTEVHAAKAALIISR